MKSRLFLLVTLWGTLPFLSCSDSIDGTKSVGMGGAHGMPCVRDSQCDDGKFCNGVEICNPSAANADDRGCTPSVDPPECDDGLKCTTDSCSNSLKRCVHSAPDEDGDGHGDASCKDAKGRPLGSDCDDGDAERFPGNGEVCDDEGHDEDCDPVTFGFKDADGDGEVDMQCCNRDGDEEHCGTDCDDDDLNRRSKQPEFCDGVDNDCDRDIDENAKPVAWFPDKDQDLYGAYEDDPEMSCEVVVGKSVLSTDCDDDDPKAYPSQIEVCDDTDNDCDGEIDEQCRDEPNLGSGGKGGSGGAAMGGSGGGRTGGGGGVETGGGGGVETGGSGGGRTGGDGGVETGGSGGVATGGSKGSGGQGSGGVENSGGAPGAGECRGSEFSPINGYYDTGDFCGEGFIWPINGGVVSTENFEDQVGAMCASGSFDACDYEGDSFPQAVIGVTLAQNGVGQSLFEVRGGGIRIAYATGGAPHFRVTLQATSSGASEDYCVDLAGTGSETLAWSDFRKECWDSGGERLEAGDFVENLLFILHCVDAPVTFVDACLEGLELIEGEAPCSEVVAEISSEHGHQLRVLAGDVLEAAERTYDIQGAATHSHSLTVSSSTFATLAESGTVQIETSTEANHSHIVTLTCIP